MGNPGNAAWAALVLCALLTPVRAGDEEPLSKSATEALAALRAAETCDDAAVGEGGDKSDTYRAYEVLRDQAPASLLVRLTRDKQPVVRCYAFRALAAKHLDVDLFGILWGHRDDFAEVRTFRGCMISGEKVADVMIDDARDRLTRKQERRLLEHLIRTKSPLFERGRLLRSTTVPAELIPELRRLVEDGDEDALIALARHRMPEDTVRIETRLRARGRSVHPDLLPVLEAAALHRDARLLFALRALAPRVHQELRKKSPGRYRAYFNALAAQSSPPAAELLASFLDLDGLSRSSREWMGEILFETVRTSAAATHVPLLWRLWEDRAQLDTVVARRLFALDAKRARSGIMRDLQTDPNRLPSDAMTVLLTLLARTDRDAAMRLV